MAILKFFRDATIQENNIVRTIASAAGTLSAIIFVLPGLIMVGWWTGFPFWLSVAVIGLGGILGVMFSVPLRRALVTGSDLPYPEGVAAAEVLKVGAGVGGAEENRIGLRMIVWSSIVSAAYALIAQTKVLATEAARSFGFGGGATTMSTSLSMALPRPRPGVCRAAWRANGDRADRRRKPVRGRLRRHRRRDRQ